MKDFEIIHWKKDDAGPEAWQLSFITDTEEQAEKIKSEITLALKLKNELERTHQFYLDSGNGFCAGVTSQILNLSSYGGEPKS